MELLVFCLVLPVLYFAGIFVLAYLVRFFEKFRFQDSIQQMQEEISDHIYEMGGKDVNVVVAGVA